MIYDVRISGRFQFCEIPLSKETFNFAAHNLGFFVIRSVVDTKPGSQFNSVDMSEMLKKVQEWRHTLHPAQD
jgi:hypothetical protein